MRVLCPQCRQKMHLTNAELSSPERLRNRVCPACKISFDARRELATSSEPVLSQARLPLFQASQPAAPQAPAQGVPVAPPPSAPAPDTGASAVRTPQTRSVKAVPFAKTSRQSPKRIGAYEIVSEINRGGMGIVYKAFDPLLRRNVAIKVLLAGEGATEEDLKRFEREAQATARLQHSNIVPIYATGVHEGKPYFVMDFIEGKTARQLKDEKRMTPRLALSIIEGVADALHHAHLNGVIHRDVKPGNIIVDPFGRAQLMDFGLARRLDEDLAITQTGTTMGTPSYMSPEQAEGKLAEVDGQSDIYSAGACLYELLTGIPPHDGQTLMAVLRKVVDEPILPPRQINPRIHRDVETICMKCLERSKNRRYATAQDLADDIRRFNMGEAISAKPVTLLSLWVKKARRHKEVSIAVCAVVMVIAVAMGMAWRQARMAARQKIQERHEALASALLSGRNSLREAQNLAGQMRSGGGHLNELSRADFESKTAQIRLKIVDAMTELRHAETVSPGEPEARRGLEELREIENALEAASLVFSARQFLKPPPPESPDQAPELPNYAGAEFAAQLALKRDPQNIEAQQLYNQAVGMREVFIDAAEGAADVSVRRIMDAGMRVTGGEPDLPLGSTPVQGRSLKPGLYIVSFLRAGLPAQQATLLVSRDAAPESLQLKITINTSEENMVLIPAGDVRLPQKDPERVLAFAIDRFEYPNKANELPRTIAQSPLEARDLCRKAGKEVCTQQQWVRACMGDSGRMYPYGPEYTGGLCAAGFDLDTGRRPSGFFPRCRTPEGIYDMSGNVAEWTLGGSTETDLGGDWNSSTKYAQLTVSCRAASMKLPEDKDYYNRLGFRCCKKK